MGMTPGVLQPTFTAGLLDDLRESPELLSFYDQRCLQYLLYTRAVSPGLQPSWAPTTGVVLLQVPISSPPTPNLLLENRRQK
jgi:hypothetical protein